MSHIIPNVSLPLDVLVNTILRDEHYVPVPDTVAEILFHHTKNNHTCYIQFPGDQDVDILGRFLTHPLLWSISAWRNSSERAMRARLRSQHEREQRFIFDANIKLVAKKMCTATGINFEICKLEARRWLLRKDSRVHAVGVVKLYTTIEELPS